MLSTTLVANYSQVERALCTKNTNSPLQQNTSVSLAHTCSRGEWVQK